MGVGAMHRGPIGTQGTSSLLSTRLSVQYREPFCFVESKPIVEHQWPSCPAIDVFLISQCIPKGHSDVARSDLGH